MQVKDQENQVLQEQFREREAGVADVLEFYSRMEEVYVSAMQSLDISQSSWTSSSTNIG